MCMCMYVYTECYNAQCFVHNVSYKLQSCTYVLCFYVAVLCGLDDIISVDCIFPSHLTISSVTLSMGKP